MGKSEVMLGKMQDIKQGEQPDHIPTRTLAGDDPNLEDVQKIFIELAERPGSPRPDPERWYGIPMYSSHDQVSTNQNIIACVCKGEAWQGTRQGGGG